MRMELEHGDVVKALAVYMKTKGFVVAPEPENFVFKNESSEPGKIELLVLVKNMDTAPPEPAAPPTPPRAPAARPAAPAQAPAARPAPRPAPPPPPPAAKKNDLFRPVAPPQLIPPAPKHRVLDKQAASSPALMLAGQHPHMPMASRVVQAFDGSEKGAEELVDDSAPPPPVRRAQAAPSESSLIVDPGEMSPEDRAVFDDILARSQARAEEGPHYAEDSANDPIRPEGHVEDE